MTRPLLLLDCYLQPPGCAGNFLPALPVEVEVLRVPRQPLPTDLARWSAVLVTGSAASVLQPPPWLTPLEELVRQAVRRSVPLLGVCFGHQVLASALVGRGAVRARPRLHIGFVDVELAPDPLFDGLPPRLPTFVTHFDEVVDPTGLSVIARGRDGGVQGLRVPGRPAWSVQFHPEIRFHEARGLLRKRALEAPDAVPDLEGELARGFDNDAALECLLGNFLRLAAEAD